MVGQPPPEQARMAPRLTVLPAGGELWRCHGSDYPPAEFNPSLAPSHFDGSRFDGTFEDPYPFLYASPDPATTLAEVLLRSVRFSGPSGLRQVPWAVAAARTLTRLRVTEDLTLVRLVSGEDLAAVFQDSWLLEGGESRYPMTRFWAHEIRRQCPEAQGLRWQSRRNPSHHAVVLFGDRCGAEPLKAVPGQSRPLGTFEGAAEANRLLAPLRAVVVPPGVRL
ncbi:RES family NAD+ phosphorylase [Streptomyces sp. NPDC014894]|uniref:RES family NAD+ phosphorylase n=1 Tax=unclassified Streptomyces TaxID=2593676 RepID=UPI0036F8EA76